MWTDSGAKSKMVRTLIVKRMISDTAAVPAIMIDEDIYKTLNASKHAVKIPKSMGEGRLATFEATHQLHCVFVLWQLAYPEYYTEKMAFAAAHPKDFFDHIGKGTQQWHMLVQISDASDIDHCADMLRQKIMCDADAGLITYSWVKGHYSPHPNFNVQHQCRDFDAIMKFANEHTVDPTNPEVGSFRRPNDDSWVDFDWEPPSDPNAGD
ncbi:hypothetical protein MMC10_008886 [Thelotrema lepadinum]|nr:hypothetical protein [Thelotrema lepadinum]